MRHRWSAWPGAWCLDCGCEDPNEVEVATCRTVSPSHPGLTECKEPNSKRHDPYARREEVIVESQKNRRRAYEVGARSFKDGVIRSSIPSWNLELVNCWRDGWDDEAAQASFIASTNKFVT